MASYAMRNTSFHTGLDRLKLPKVSLKVVAGSPRDLLKMLANGSPVWLTLLGLMTVVIERRYCLLQARQKSSWKGMCNYSSLWKLWKILLRKLVWSLSTFQLCWTLQQVDTLVCTCVLILYVTTLCHFYYFSCECDRLNHWYMCAHNHICIFFFF